MLVRVKAYDYYDEDFYFFIHGIQGVDGEYIKLALKYEETYSYTTAMGAVKTIYSFKPDLIFNNKEFTEAQVQGIQNAILQWEQDYLEFENNYEVSYYDYKKQVEKGK